MIVCKLFKYHMTIDLKTIKHISKLSRISVDDAKAKKLEGDLNSIFEFIEKLNQLETENIEPAEIAFDANVDAKASPEAMVVLADKISLLTLNNSSSKNLDPLLSEVLEPI